MNIVLSFYLKILFFPNIMLRFKNGGPCGETDIITVFGTVVGGSNPSRDTKPNQKQ